MKTKTALAALLLAAATVPPICNAENLQNLSLQYRQKTGYQAGYEDGYKVGKIGRELPNRTDRISMGRRAALRNNIPRQYHSSWIYAYVDAFLRGWAAGEVDGRKRD